MPEPIPTGPMAKRLLLGLLAERQHERLGLRTTDRGVAETTRWYRARFGLLRATDLDAFLRSCGVSRHDFDQQMRSFHTIDQMDAHHDSRIQQRLGDYEALFSVADWVLQREG